MTLHADLPSFELVACVVVSVIAAKRTLEISTIRFNSVSKAFESHVHYVTTHMENVIYSVTIKYVTDGHIMCFC